MKEEWKLIKNYEKYMVSNTGKVKSLDYMHTGKEHILKGIVLTNGYVTVGLYNRGKHRRFLVHRLVAESFIPNPNNYSEVNHIDCNKQNNCTKNLEWVTPKENIMHGIKNGRIKFNNFILKGKEYIQNKCIKVQAIDKDGRIYEFHSLSEAAQKLSVHASAIGRVIKGERKSAGGYRFKKM